MCKLAVIAVKPAQLNQYWNVFCAEKGAAATDLMSGDSDCHHKTLWDTYGPIWRSNESQN